MGATASTVAVLQSAVISWRNVMTVSENLETFAGKPVEDYNQKTGLRRPEEVAYRVRIAYDEYEDGSEICAALNRVLDEPNSSRLEALVIGAWDYESSTNSAAIVELLSGAAERLPGLRALFLGDITYEEQEISWIQQSDVSPLLMAFPDLEIFRVRGTENLAFGALRHAKLRHLAIESGGLPHSIMAAVAHAELPQLEHLELWLGDSGYGYDGCTGFLPEMLRPDRFPHLRYLGLENAEDEDEVVIALIATGALERIAVLNLSMGTLSDDGARALLETPAVRRLEKLVIRHHYMSPDMVKELEELGIETDIGDAQEPDGEYRYVAVSE